MNAGWKPPSDNRNSESGPVCSCRAASPESTIPASVLSRRLASTSMANGSALNRPTMSTCTLTSGDFSGSSTDTVPSRVSCDGLEVSYRNASRILASTGSPQDRPIITPAT